MYVNINNAARVNNYIEIVKVCVYTNSSLVLIKRYMEFQVQRNLKENNLKTIYCQLLRNIVKKQ